jgi:selenocysteine lyase/cysteine desulfurase
MTSIIDGAHPLGMIQFSIADIDCDYYAGCLHKWLLAPLGLGFVYIRKDKLESTNLFNVGAYSLPNFDMTAENLVAENLVQETQRYSTGSFCGPLYEAGERAIDWYEAIGPERIEKRVKELSLFTQEELEKLNNNIEILSPKEESSRGALTTFRFRNKKANEFVAFARKEKESFLLRHIHEAKLDGVRISTHYYNDFQQIEKLIAFIAGYINK